MPAGDLDPDEIDLPSIFVESARARRGSQPSRASRQAPAPAWGRCALLMTCVLAAACTSKKPAAQIACFTRTAGGNSPETRRLFSERSCHGGGVTWAEIFRVLARRLGKLEPMAAPPRGWSGQVSTLDGLTHVSIDDEGDAARVCADDSHVLDDLRAGAIILNDDPRGLREALNEASALRLGCLEADGGAPQPAPAPPATR